MRTLPMVQQNQMKVCIITYNIKTLPEIIQKEAALYNSMLNRKKCKRFND